MSRSCPPRTLRPKTPERGSAGRSGRPVESPGVIDRDEVLHVARLARLELGEEELEPMARELSAVLDHIATIGELDLDDVPPTSHVVEMTGGLRPDEPRACLPREVALAQAPA